MIALRPHLLLPALFLLGFCLRTPLFGLPLEGEGARLASVAAHWSAQGPTVEAGGTAPLLPALVAPAIALGAPPTAALRWADAFFAALLAPLLVLLGLGLGYPRARAALAGLLLAVHPLALAGAGGIEPGTGSLAAVLALGALVAVGAAPLGRRLGMVAALLLLAADPHGLLVAPVLLYPLTRREPSPRLQTAVWMLAGALLLAAPLTWWRWAPVRLPDLGSLAAWSAAATLGLLLPALPGGLGALARGAPRGRLLLLVGGLAVLMALAGGSGAQVLVLALVLLVGARGLAAWSAPWVGRAMPAAVGGALLASLWLVSGSLQATLAPTDPGAAGRLHQLRVALQHAAAAAGERGWIVLAVPGQGPEEQASLADLVPRHWAWAERVAEHGSALRPLHVFPAASLESGRSVAIVAAGDRRGGIHTFDGAGIYHEELLREVGPYVVLRARRP